MPVEITDSWNVCESDEVSYSFSASPGKDRMLMLTCMGLKSATIGGIEGKKAHVAWYRRFWRWICGEGTIDIFTWKEDDIQAMSGTEVLPFKANAKIMQFEGVEQCN